MASLDYYTPGSSDYFLNQYTLPSSNTVFGGGSAGGTTGASGSWGTPTTTTTPTNNTPTTTAPAPSTPTEPIPVESVLQTPPPPPEPDPWEAPINEAIADLRELESQFQSQLPGQLENIQGASDVARKGIETEQAQRAKEFGMQTSEARGVGEASTNEQKRMYGEAMQGLASRFGGSTGTGIFGGELMGRQTSRNVANIRNTVLGTIQKINLAKGKIDDTAMQLKAQLFNETETLKQRARDALNTNLLEIRNMTGALQGKKGEMAMQALQQYRQMVNQIDGRNADFLQRIAEGASRGKLLLTNFQNSARDKYTAQINGLSNFNMGNLAFQPQAYGYSPGVAGQGYYNPGTTGTTTDEETGLIDYLKEQGLV